MVYRNSSHVINLNDVSTLVTMCNKASFIAYMTELENNEKSTLWYENILYYYMIKRMKNVCIQIQVTVAKKCILQKSISYYFE